MRSIFGLTKRTAYGKIHSRERVSYLSQGRPYYTILKRRSIGLSLKKTVMETLRTKENWTAITGVVSFWITRQPLYRLRRLLISSSTTSCYKKLLQVILLQRYCLSIVKHESSKVANLYKHNRKSVVTTTCIYR